MQGVAGAEYETVDDLLGDVHAPLSGGDRAEIGFDDARIRAITSAGPFADDAYRAPAGRGRRPAPGPPSRSARPAAPDRPRSTSSRIARQQLVDQPRRQTGGRLVEQQHARAGQQRAAHRHHLPLAARQHAAPLWWRRSASRGKEARRSRPCEKRWRPVVSAGGRTSARFSIDGQLGEDALAFRHQRRDLARHPRCGARPSIDAPAPRPHVAAHDRAAARPAGQRVDSVDLPAPLAPTMPTIFPAGTLS